MSSRLWAVDALRGFAVVLMILFHSIADLQKVGGYKLGLGVAFWWGSPTVIAGIFLFLVGFSQALAIRRRPEFRTFGRHFRRGAGVLACGLGITAVTAVIDREHMVVFGILHLIGVSIWLAYPMLRLKPSVLGTSAAAAIGLGIALTWVEPLNPVLYHLGFGPRAGGSWDFFTLLPWFGVVLAGAAAANSLSEPLPDGHLIARPRPAGRVGTAVRAAEFLGRHSLIIYLVHQPVLIGIYWLAGIARI